MGRILVIDDDAEVRQVLEEILTLAGHNVILAADGREGMETHRAAPADLVITDLFMPIQEGLETIMVLRKESPALPIIAVSGKHTESPMLSVAQRLGATRVLQKPFQTEELLAAVGELLRPESPPR